MYMRGNSFVNTNSNNFNLGIKHLNIPNFTKGSWDEHTEFLQLLHFLETYVIVKEFS